MKRTQLLIKTIDLRRCDIYNGILLSQKMNKTLLFAGTWMDLENIILGTLSQTKKDNILYDITYLWNLKTNTNESVYKKETEL